MRDRCDHVTVAAVSTESAIRDRSMLERKKELSVLPVQVKANLNLATDPSCESDGRVSHCRDKHCITPGSSKEDINWGEPERAPRKRVGHWPTICKRT